MENEAKVDKDGKPIEPSSLQVTEPSEDDKPKYSTKQVNDYIAALQSGKDIELADLRPKAALAVALGKQLDEANAELAKSDEAKAQVEQEAVKGDPDALALVKQRQALAVQVKQLAQQKVDALAEVTDVDARNKAANDYKAMVLAVELATKYGVDANKLLSFGSQSPEEMERIAKGLSEGTPEGDKDKHKRVISPTPAGGEDWRNLPAEDKIKQAVSKTQ